MTEIIDRCSVCGTPYVDTGKKQQCRVCGMFANLCCDPQMPLQEGPGPADWSAGTNSPIGGAASHRYLGQIGYNAGVMSHSDKRTPPRDETAGEVEEEIGDVDAEPENSTLTTLDPGNDIGPDQGGTPGDASGEMGASGAASG